MMNMVPYFINIACPDYKRPKTISIKDKINISNINELNDFFISYIAEQMVICSIEYEKTFSSYEEYVNHLYKESYMEQEPYEISYFYESEWVSFDTYKNNNNIYIKYCELLKK